MTTPAFPESILTKIRAGHQACRFKATLGEVVQFRAYCCNIDSDGIMGVSKTPVAQLSLTPNPVCLGDAVAFNFAGSYAPGSTIISYTIDMGDFTTYNVSSGNHTYGAAGTYNVVGTVVEGLGKSQTIEAQVIVTDCDEPLLMTYTYLGTYGDGVYFIDWTDLAPAWVTRNIGLTGNALLVNSLAMNPATKFLADAIHELWIASEGGVYRSFTGGRSWAKLNLPDPSNVEYGDVSPSVIGDLGFLKVVMSDLTPNTTWILAYRDSPARMWVYRTTDAGITWSSRGLML